MPENSLRTETDSLGTIEVPKDKYWGAQTQRALTHFAIGTEKMPHEIIKALAIIKKAAALTNAKLKILSSQKAKLIIQATDEIIAGKLADNFPLMIWQSGSGTQTNMNINEVIANRAIEITGGTLGSKNPVHPNDDVNLSQSSNDVFPTAIHLAGIEQLTSRLLPALRAIYNELQNKQKEFNNIVKVGRTHLQDAVPLTLGQEFSGYAGQINENIERTEQAYEALLPLAIGGTAVGTGLNASPEFTKRVIPQIAQITSTPCTSAANKFCAIAAHDSIVFVSGILKTIACSLMKIANDIRWMSSGPRCGLGELNLPINEPGSSIMPGKINPSQCEAMRMICTQIIGNDTTITLAGSQGDFELNVFKPVMAFNLLQSINLLADVCFSFTEHLLKGLKPNEPNIATFLSNSLMTATVLTTHIGYDKTAEITLYAYKNNLTLRQACINLGHLSAKDFDNFIQPDKMLGD